MRIKARFEQLSLLAQFDEPLQRYYKFADILEGQLSNLKYLHKQIEKGDVDDANRFSSLRFLRDAQVNIAKLLLILGREYEGKQLRENFDYYWDGFIKDRISNGYLQNPHTQYELYEMMHSQRARFSGVLVQFHKLWQPFCETLVKDIEEQLKKAQYALQ